MHKPRTPESIEAEICELEVLACQAALADSEDDQFAHALFLQLISQRRRDLERLK